MKPRTVFLVALVFACLAVQWLMEHREGTRPATVSGAGRNEVHRSNRPVVPELRSGSSEVRGIVPDGDIHQAKSALPDAPPAMSAAEMRRSLLARAQSMQERETKPDTLGRYVKRRLVRVDFKYPLLRVEESWVRDPSTGAERMTAGRIVVADHFLVTLREGTTLEAFEQSLVDLGGRVRRHQPNSRVYLIELGSSDLDLFDSKLAQFRETAGPLEIVEPDDVVFASAVVPNDPAFPALWGMHNTGQWGGKGDADIDAPEAWESATGSPSVVVGVIDTGIDYHHPDLAANIWLNEDEIAGNGLDDDGNGYVDDLRGWDFSTGNNDPADDHFHGTHCAGTIGAVGNNGIGIAGVCHTVRLMALKFLSSEGYGTTSDAIEAIRYATAKHATLTSNSWGGGGYSQTLKNAIDDAGAAGILFVAAAGNEGQNTDAAPSFPASYDSANIISVAASDPKDVLSWFSNHGVTTVDLAAPGELIYSTTPANTYRHLDGTSMACPHVAGACALMKAARPGMTGADIKGAILANVDPVESMAGKLAAGGRLNLLKALGIATGPYVTLAALQPWDDGRSGSSGNADGILNAGETIAMVVSLKNAGVRAADGLSVSITSTSDGGRISVLQGTRAFGSLPAGDTAANDATPFLIRIAPDTATPHPFTIHVGISDADGHVWTSHAQFMVRSSGSVSGRVTVHANGMGVPGALVRYSGPDSGSVTAAADGTYSVRLTDGTYEFVASAPGYTSSVPVPVTVPPGAGNVNFTLGRSRVRVAPVSLTSTQPEDSIVSKTITITNDGDQPLVFTASTAPLVGGLAAELSAGAPGKPMFSGAATDGDVRPRMVYGTTTLPFFEGFESGGYSGWLRGWTGGTREVVSDTAAAGAKSFRYSNWDPPNFFHGIHRDFVAGTRPRNISFWVRTGTTTANSGCVTLLDGTYSCEIIWFAALGDGRFYVNGDVGGDHSYNYQALKWYRVEFRNIDWGAKKFDYYVNGALVKPDINFRDQAGVDEVTSLHLFNHTPGSEAWWDDIRVFGENLTWLGVTPDGGNLAPGQSITLTVEFDATGKPEGDYLGLLEFNTNDPASPVVSVPVTMTVQPASNTPPVADSATVTMNEDSASVITLTGGDADGHTLWAQIQTLPALGRLYQTGDGISPGEPVTSVPAMVHNSAKKLIYMPPPNANGSPIASFQFVMKDARAKSASATVTLNVTPVNDLPAAFDDAVSGQPGDAVSPIRVLLNDMDSDGQDLTITSFTQGQKGSVSENGDGTLRFIPDPGFTSGSDAFTYTVGDGTGATATATVRVTLGIPAGGSWPMMGRDASHTGYCPATLSGQAFAPSWTTRISARPLNQVAIAGNRAFVTTDSNHVDGRVYAVDLATGQPIWKKEWPAHASSLSGPSYHSDTIYVQRCDGPVSHLWALDAANGDTRWSSPYDAQINRHLPPTVTDDAVFMNGGTYGGMYGIDRATGARRFFHLLSQFDNWTPSVHNNKVYSFVGGVFRQHHPGTGLTEWGLDLSWNMTSYSMNRAAAIASGAAFVVNNRSSGNELVCIDLASNAVRWRTQAGFEGTPAVSGSRVFAFDGTGDVRAYDIVSGALLRTFSTGIGTAGLYQPIVTDDTLIASSSAGTSVHSLVTGENLQSIAAGGIPSLGNGCLLLAGADGMLRCHVLLSGNSIPAATPLTSTCIEDQTLLIALPGTDADGDSLTAIVTSLPSKGTLYQTSDGTQAGDPITAVPAVVRNPARRLIYRPPPDGFGSPFTTFGFVVNDGRISSPEATVTVHVTNVNDAPVAMDETVFLRPGGILAACNPVANDRDADGDAISINSFTQPAKGTVTRNADGTLRYVPRETFVEGDDPFQYTIGDGAGASSTASVRVVVGSQHGREWTQFGNGPDHTGRYPGTLGTEPWVQLWEYAFPQAVGAPAVGAGNVYLTTIGNWSTYGWTVALDANTGAETWRTRFEPCSTLNPPAFHKGVVYTQRNNDRTDTQLWALDAKDGAVHWSAVHSGNVNRYLSPAVSDLGVFLHGGAYGSLFGFTHDGNRKFDVASMHEALCTPTLHEGLIYTYSNGYFTCHHPQFGAPQWSLDLTWFNGLSNRTVCCASGRAYVTNASTGGAELICIDLRERAVAWRTMGAFNGTPAVANGMVYACHGGTVKAYHCVTGAWLADFTAPGETFLTNAPVVSDDLLFVTSDTKTHVFSLATRSIVQTLESGGRIAIADDIIYLAGMDNRVRAYGRKDHSNRAPVAIAAQAGVPEDSEASIILEADDPDGEATRVVIRSLPARGTLYQTVGGGTKGAAILTVPTQVSDSDGRIIYKAARDDCGIGAGSFTFTAHDRASASVPAAVTINVTPVNDPPLAIADTVALYPGEPMSSFLPQANDRDPDGDHLQLATFTQGTTGQVSRNPDGSIRYVPASGFTGGTDTFNYTIRDAGGLESGATVTIIISPTVARAWTTFGGGPEHTGFVPVGVGPGDWGLRWQATPGQQAHQLAVADGKIFACLKAVSGSSSVLALDANSGEMLWRRDFSDSYHTNAPAWHDGAVYTVCANLGQGSLYRLDATTGGTVWQVPYDAGTAPQDLLAPVIDSTGVFASGGMHGGLIGHDVASGSRIYYNSIPGDASAWTPTLHGSSLYSFAKGRFRSHDKATGAILWTLDVGWITQGFTPMNRTTAFTSGRAFLINDPVTIPPGRQTLVCIDTASQAVAWSVEDRFTGTPAVAHQAVFAIAGSDADSIRSYDADTGALLGVYPLPEGEDGLTVQPIVTNDRVIAASGSKTYVFDLANRTLRHTVLRGGAISLADGTLHIASPDGTISAWGVRPVVAFTPAGGVFASPVGVTVESSDVGARIHYTVDDSTPDESSPWIPSGAVVSVGWAGRIRAVAINRAGAGPVQEAAFTLTDADADGLPDWWEAECFGDLTTASAASDSDGDGANDPDEFAAGTNPRSRPDKLTHSVSATPGGGFAVKWLSKPDRLYVVESSTDLLQWKRESPGVRGTGGEMEHRMTPAATGRFFTRVRVSPALSGQ